MEYNKNCNGCLGASFGDCDRCERMKKDKVTDTDDNKTTNGKEKKNE